MRCSTWQSIPATPCLQAATIVIATALIRIETEAELEPGDYVCVSVRDTGEGMTADVLARATEPFFSTKPLGKGTGLGLAQVYGIARQAGGTLRIESEPGEGHECPAVDPGRRGGNRREREVERAEGAGRRGALRAGRARSWSWTTIMRSAPSSPARSRSLGYSVIEAEGGAQALARLDEGAPRCRAAWIRDAWHEWGRGGAGGAASGGPSCRSCS